MDIINAYIDFWRRSSKFKGKSNRTEFFVGFPINFGILILFLILKMVLQQRQNFLAIFIVGFISLTLFCGLFNLFARRLRDAGFSPWWLLLIILIPIGGIGLIVTLIMCCFPSRESKGKYKKTLGVTSEQLVKTIDAKLINSGYEEYAFYEFAFKHNPNGAFNLKKDFNGVTSYRNCMYEDVLVELEYSDSNGTNMTAFAIHFKTKNESSETALLDKNIPTVNTIGEMIRAGIIISSIESAKGNEQFSQLVYKNYQDIILDMLLSEKIGIENGIYFDINGIRYFAYLEDIYNVWLRASLSS